VSELPQGTVTFLFTDIEGSTELLKRLGPGYGDLLEDHARIIRASAAAHSGREVDNQGDSFFFAFPRANAALATAVVAQRALAAHEWPEGVDVRVRMGLHTGEPSIGGERYVGIGVHRAARIGASGHGGQVLLSSATRELVEEESHGVVVRELGLYRLKDIDVPERLYQLDIAGLPTDFPPLKAEKVVPQRTPRRRPLLVGALAVVIAAAVAVTVFALNSGNSGTPASAPLAGNSAGAVDLSTARLVESVPLGASPNAVAAGAGSVWIAMSNRGVVERIDPTTNQVQQTITVPGGPSSLAVGDGLVWVAESLAGKVAEIDPKLNGGQVTGKITVGNGPTGVAWGLGGVWVANSVDRTVVRIDPASGRTSAPISVDAGADSIAVGNGAVWVTGQASGVLSKIDPSARTVSVTASVGSEPSALSTGRGAVWVANSADGTVSRIDPMTGHPQGLIAVGQGPSGVAVATDGAVWVANELSGTVSKIDSQTNNVVKTVTVGGTPQGIAISGGTAYVPAQESQAAHRGGTLRLAISNPPDSYTAPLPESLDPAATGPHGSSAWELLTVTNDGLLGYSRAGGADSYTVVPDLAVALPTVSDGGRTYTFQLRGGIHYSTGATVTPADVRRGIERALAEDDGGFYLSGIVGAKGCIGSGSDARCDLSRGIVTSPDSSTIVFHLTKADPDFIYQLALPPYDAVPATTPLKAPLPLPATGPYEIAAYRAKAGVVWLRRNPRFRVWSARAQPGGYPDQIVERYGYTGANAVRAVEQGSADITTDGLDQTWPPAIARSLETRYSSQLYEAPLLAILGLWLNSKLPPFDDVRVRQALNYAVDRQRLVEINGGAASAQVTCQILPPDVLGFERYCPYTARPDATGTYHGPDLARARRLVAASGTKGQRVTVWFYDIPVGRANGAYFVSVLRKLGYDARLETVPHTGPVWRADRQAGVAGWGGGLPTPSDTFSSFTCRAYSPSPETNANAAAFCDRRIDAQIKKARALQTTNPAAAATLWRSIDRQITNDAPWVAMKLFLSTDFISSGTGNYKFCWLSGFTGLTGACLDQLWVR
jgi:YVTN family beta-propeller protein